MFSCLVPLVRQHITTVKWNTVSPFFFFMLLAFSVFRFFTFRHALRKCYDLGFWNPSRSHFDILENAWASVGKSTCFSEFLKRNVCFSRFEKSFFFKTALAGRAVRICNVPMADQCSFIQCQRNTPLTYAAYEECFWVIHIKHWKRRKL